MNKHRNESWSCRRLRRAALLAAGALSLVLGGCRGGADDEAAGRGDAPEVMQIPMGNFTAAWRAQLPLGQTKVRELYLNDDKVFVMTSDNRCIWVQRASGHVLSITRAAPSTDTVHEPVTLRDRVVFPTTSMLAVFDRGGKPMHRIPLRFGAASGVVGLGITVFLGLDHPSAGRLVAMSTHEQPYDIPPIWELMTRGQISATPAIYDGQLFIGSRDGGVYAVRADTREVLWPGLELGYFNCGGPIVADLKADKEGVYVSSMDSKMYCLDVTTGRVRWIYYSGRPLREDSSPVVTQDSVYLHVPQTGLVAINKAGPTEIRSARWTVAGAHQFLASDEKYAYLGMEDHAIACVDKATGQEKFRTRRNDFAIYAANTSAKDSTIYATTAGGMLYAVNAVLKPGTIGEWVMEERALEAVAKAK